MQDCIDQAAEMGFGMTLGDEEKAVTENEAGGNFNQVGW